MRAATGSVPAEQGPVLYVNFLPTMPWNVKPRIEAADERGDQTICYRPDPVGALPVGVDFVLPFFFRKPIVRHFVIHAGPQGGAGRHRTRYEGHLFIRTHPRYISSPENAVAIR